MGGVCECVCVCVCALVRACACVCVRSRAGRQNHGKQHTHVGKTPSSKHITVKPPNSGHFGDRDYVRSREVVPFSEVAYEATPTDNEHGGVVYR